jgi:hypothetical protein
MTKGYHYLSMISDSGHLFEKSCIQFVIQNQRRRDESKRFYEKRSDNGGAENADNGCPGCNEKK